MIVITALVLLTGCASSAKTVATAVTQAPTAGSATHALRLWKAFPVRSSPRPLVLAGPAIDDPATGFLNGADKLAYLGGRFVVRTALPASSATWQQKPLITSAQALTDLRGHPQGGASTASQLMITNVHLASATFSTDRGQRRLPAWVFTLAGVRDPASVLAIAPTDRWPKAAPAGNDPQDLSARIGAGGSTVTITFVGAAAGTGPCTAQYAPDVAQSSSAVQISIRQTHTSKGDGGGCTAIGYRRVVAVRLTPGLAGRVLIDSYGAPIPAG